MFGFGYSDSKGRIEDKQIWVDQIAALLDGLGIDKVSMVGNSFGGGIALAFTIAHPDRVERAVLMGPAGLEFPITPALDEVWGYVPSVEAMRSSLEYLAWDHSRLTDDLIKSRYAASMRPGAQEPYHAPSCDANRQANIAMLASRGEGIAALQQEMPVLHGRFGPVIPLASSVHLETVPPRAADNACGDI